MSATTIRRRASQKPQTPLGDEIDALEERQKQLFVEHAAYEKRMKDSLEKLQKMSKKTIATMNQLREDVLETEKFDKELINEDIVSVRSEHATTIETWWNTNIASSVDAKIKSNSLFHHFQEKTRAITITSDMFKTTLKTMLREDEIQHGKLQKSQYTILGYKFV